MARTAALDIEGRPVDAGVFDDAGNDHLAEFRSGLAQLLDGIAARIKVVGSP